MRSCGTTERTVENGQTTASAQLNAVLSSQRFYGLEEEFTERIQLYALKNLFFYQSASMNEKQRTIRSDNK